MQDLWIPHNAWILVGDGRKAMVLRNVGTPQRLDLRVTNVLRERNNPPTHAQGSDRPGRVMDRTTTRRSAVEQTDWHEIAEKNFAGEVAEILDRAAQNGAFEQIVLVAPPRTLAELRSNLGAEARRRVIAEIDKDLTKHPIPEITSLLAGR